jgi:hypothetical protein
MRQIVVLHTLNAEDDASEIARRMQERGYAVPWSAARGGGMAHDDGKAPCYVVLWTRDAGNSRWVWPAAVAAHDNGRLIEVLIHDVDSPFDSPEKPIDFRNPDDKVKMQAEWKELIRRVEEMTGEPLGKLSLKKQFEPAAAAAGLGGVVVGVMMFFGANLQPTSDGFVAQQAAYDTHELDPVALGGPVASPSVLTQTDTFTPVEVAQLDPLPLTILRIERDVSTAEMAPIEDESKPPA